MKITGIYDLSHIIYPGKEEYRLDLDIRQVDEWEEFVKYPREKDSWYVVSEVCMNSHTGTHIEFPYHHIKNGLDASSFPVDKLVGEGVVIDLSKWGNNQAIELDDLVNISSGRVKKGDIIYFYTGLDRYYRTEKQHHRPWFTNECIHWLVDSAKIKVMGVDTSGHEMRTPDGEPYPGQPNHLTLFQAGVPLIEYMTNLNCLLNKRFLTLILPIKITGIEAFPVRVIALEVENS